MHEFEVEEIKNNVFDSIENCKTLLQGENMINALMVNIRSIKKHWDTLMAMINDILDDLQLLILLETNITEDELQLFEMNDFNVVAKCRETRSGGGIAVYYRKNLDINILQSTSFLSTESLIIEFPINHQKFIVAVFYRPPSNSITDFNSELESWLISKDKILNKKNIIILGDINIDTLNDKRKSTTIEYLNILNSTGIQMGIKTPTREELLNNNIVSSCIDHIGTRLKPELIDTFVIQSKIADHYFIGFRIKSHKEFKKTNPTIKKTIDIISDKKVNTLIQNFNWGKYLTINNPTLLYSQIESNFNIIYKEATIKINITKQRNYQPWLNETIKQNIEKKNTLWSKLKRNPNNTIIRTEYIKQRNHLTNIIRKEKRSYYFNKIQSHTGDMKNTWDTVNEILNARRKSTLETIKNNFKIEDDNYLGLCNKFNEFFHNNIELLNKNIMMNKFDISDHIKTSTKTERNTSLYMTKMDMDTIENIINNLNTTASPGIDNIKPKHIKINVEHIKHILLHLYNLILKSNKIPDKMKTTILKPIYKNGKKDEPVNYRPIGAISVIMKILEYGIHNKVMKYCVENKIFNPSQYGFIPGKSTTQLLEKVAHSINLALDNRQVVPAILLDLTKAFDTIHHSTLIEKLQRIGIRGPTLELFQNYFINRHTIVKLGHTCSIQKPQKYGIIQGSPLAPLLFNLYINDLQDYKLKGQIYNYADDTIIMHPHKNLRIAIDHLQSDLNILTQYFHNNHIHINNQKTKTIVFRNPKIQCNVIDETNRIVSHEYTCYNGNSICNCTKIRHSDYIKYLGLFFDSNMKWSTHTQILTKKLRILAYRCFQLRDLITTEAKRTIYFSLVESQLRYGITVYGHAPQYFLNPIITTINRIHRTFFTGINIKTLGILNFKNLQKYVIIVKYYFNEKYRNARTINYSIRQRRYTPGNYNTSLGMNNPEYFVPVLLNNLPINLRSLRTYSEVKKLIKSHLLNSS
jgi:hypothetical protein